MSNISSLCYNPTPQNGASTEVYFPIADAEIRKAIYTDSLKTYIGLPATPAISIDSSNNNNRLSFWPTNNNTQIPLTLQGNDSPLISNDSTIKIIGQNTGSIYYLVQNSYENLANDNLYFLDTSFVNFKSLFLGTDRKINGTKVSHGITLQIRTDNGTRGIQLNSEVWREAFEIKDLGLVETIPGDTKSIPNNQWTNLCSKKFDAGTWLIHCIANFPVGTNIRNNVVLSASANGGGDSIFSGAYEKSNSSGTNIVNFTTIKQFTASATKYLNVYQNSGKALNVYGGMKAVKICDFVA